MRRLSSSILFQVITINIDECNKKNLNYTMTNRNFMCKYQIQGLNVDNFKFQILIKNMCGITPMFSFMVNYCKHNN